METGLDGFGWRTLESARIPSTLTWDRDLLLSLPGGRVLDIGCGPAPGSVPTPGGTRICLDHNLSAVANARGSTRCDLAVCGDASALPFAAGTFDVVLCKAVLTAVVDEGRCRSVISESARVARRGGAVVVSDFLINDRDPYYAARYDACAVGPYGTFLAVDPSGGSAGDYTARHFDRRWVVDQVAMSDALDLVGYTEQRVRTRSGRESVGFTAVVHRR
ncbi:class I SAM-dependent methyltransferase [Umezawaea sp.]|uniref:class I SAM-dependent methyltransferase n=1 Tax=Umezawaea sp. TaxID=1955258 RepID=UPI002ED495A8